MESNELFCSLSLACLLSAEHNLKARHKVSKKRKQHHQRVGSVRHDCHRQSGNSSRVESSKVFASSLGVHPRPTSIFHVTKPPHRPRFPPEIQISRHPLELFRMDQRPPLLLMVCNFRVDFFLSHFIGTHAGCLRC
jgi:hypothetical protein